MLPASLLLVSAPERAGGGLAERTSLVSHVPASQTTTAGPYPLSNPTSLEAVVSADGAFVAFTSFATNLVSGQNDTNGTRDVFLYERATGAVTLVSHSGAGLATTGNDISYEPSISGDGAYVAFSSQASNLPGVNDVSAYAPDVYLYERATGALTLVSHRAPPLSPDTTANADSWNPRISLDGAYVAFESGADNLVPFQNGGANGAVYLYERATGSVALVSHTAGSSSTITDSSSQPSISADGAYVAFQSTGTDLFLDQFDTNNQSDVFVYNRDTKAITLASHAGTATTTGNGRSQRPSISADGRYVAFESLATNLVTGQSDGNGASDAFLFDRSTAAVALVSHVPFFSTTAANGSSVEPAVSSDGSVVVFRSTATNLVHGQIDGNGVSDVFLYDRSTGEITLVSHAAGEGARTANQGAVPFEEAVSENGAFVAFQSTSTDLVTTESDANGASDVFLYERSTGTVSLVSRAGGGLSAAGNAESVRPSISANGTFVAFQSLATNVVDGQSDGNGGPDVFLFRRYVELATPGDLVGNGTTSIAVFRPTIGYWFLPRGDPVPFGTSGDVPVPADYDGDGSNDIAVYRPSNGYWFIRNGPIVHYGASEDIPVPADYDGDGDADIAVYRPSLGYWFIRGGPTLAFGTTGDIPVPADYDGDGEIDIAVYRPSLGYWFIRGGPTVAWGTDGDIPVPGDYGGNGQTDIAVFRPLSGYWFVRGGDTRPYGTTGDVPLPLPDHIRRFIPPPH